MRLKSCLPVTPIEVDHEISRDHSASSTTTRTSTSASRVVLRMSRATPRATKISRRGCKTKNITKWTIKGATVQCHAKGNSVLEAGVYIKSKLPHGAIQMRITSLLLNARKTTVSNFAFGISLISSRPVQLRRSAPVIVEHWPRATLLWYIHPSPISGARSIDHCTQPSFDAIGVAWRD